MIVHYAGKVANVRFSNVPDVQIRCAIVICNGSALRHIVARSLPSYMLRSQRSSGYTAHQDSIFTLYKTYSI